MYRLKKFIAGFKQQGGFLLVDSIAAVVILAIGLTAVGTLYMYGTDYRMRASNRQKAVQIAAERIERLKVDEAIEGGTSLDDLNKTIDKIQNEEVTLTDSETFTVEMADAISLESQNGESADAGIAIVKTTVRWPKDKNDHSITLYSYIRTTD